MTSSKGQLSIDQLSIRFSVFLQCEIANNAVIYGIFEYIFVVQEQKTAMKIHFYPLILEGFYILIRISFF